jgi:hypothetical protein
MNRRTRHVDGREEQGRPVEFEHLLDPADEALVDPQPPDIPAVADATINDDLLPAPRRRRWARR